MSRPRIGLRADAPLPARHFLGAEARNDGRYECRDESAVLGVVGGPEHLSVPGHGPAAPSERVRHVVEYDDKRVARAEHKPVEPVKIKEPAKGTTR